jgi:hypothetical protein
MDFKKPSKEDKYKKDWFDWWLSDDPPAPVAQEELRRTRVEQANRYKPRLPQSGPRSTNSVEPAKPAAPTNITINLDFSKIKLPKLPGIKLPALPYKQLGTGAVAVAVLFGAITLVYHHHQQSVEAAKLEAARQAVAGPTRTTPSFTPAVPKDKPDLAKLDRQNKSIAYDGNRDAYSFSDTLDSNNITVSEQPLPSNLGEPQQAVAAVAKQINAKVPITLKDGVAYMGSDSKSGAQTIVFSINDLLVFINSPFHHDAASYKFYIENLQ